MHQKTLNLAQMCPMTANESPSCNERATVVTCPEEDGLALSERIRQFRAAVHPAFIYTILVCHEIKTHNDDKPPPGELMWL